MLWIVLVGLVAICALGYLCSRVLKGRSGFEPMSQADLQRRADLEAETGLHRARMEQSRSYDGYTGL